MLYVLLAVVSLLAGVITSIAGGGGILTVTFLLMLNIPFKTVIATNRVSALLDNGTSAYNYHKNGKVNTTFLKVAIAPMFAGTLIGIRLLKMMSGETLEKMVPFVLFALITYSFFNKKMGIESKFEGFNKKNMTYGLIFMFIVGIYFGFFGAASGNIIAFGLVYIFKFDFLEAVATSKPILFFTAILSVVIYAFYGMIDYKIALFITVFRIVGSRFGSTYASKKGAGFVKPMFLALGVVTVVKEIFSYMN